MFNQRGPKTVLVRSGGAITAAALTAFVAGAGMAYAADTAVHTAQVKHAQFATAYYSIYDVGAPPTDYSSFQQPLGFNDTDQIVGAAQPSGSPSYQACIAFTGKGWVSIEGAKSLTCYPSSGITDANSSGVFKAVGFTNIATNSNYIPFFSLVGPTSATTTNYPTYAPGALYAIDQYGLATGYSYYEPYGGFSYPYPPIVQQTGQNTQILQPYCTTSVTACMESPYYYNAGGGFASRSINSHGTVFGAALNPAAGTWVEYTGGTSPTALRFSLPNDGSNAAQGIRGIDDNGDVAYYEYDTKAAAYYTWIYNPKTSTARNIGTLAGSSCTAYVPLWINGPGRILGQAENCSYAGDATYWTWDPYNGMVAITFDHTSYSANYLYIINNNGQVVGDFYAANTGAHHWAFLTPPTKL